VRVSPYLPTVATRSGVFGCRPGDRRRIYPSGERAAVVARQVDRRFETTSLDRRRDELWLDSIEHQLGSPEHLEAAVWANVTPREVDEAVASLALHCRPTEVEIVRPDDLDVYVPRRLGLICSDEVSSFATYLHPYVHVLHQRPIRTAERSPRQIGASDRHSHAPIMPEPTTPLLSSDTLTSGAKAADLAPRSSVLTIGQDDVLLRTGRHTAGAAFPVQ
jgi:hypothetical protein